MAKKFAMIIMTIALVAISMVAYAAPKLTAEGTGYGATVKAAQQQALLDAVRHTGSGKVIIDSKQTVYTEVGSMRQGMVAYRAVISYTDTETKADKAHVAAMKAKAEAMHISATKGMPTGWSGVVNAKTFGIQSSVM